MNLRLLGIWRERLWLWLPALVFFLLNLGLFSFYRVAYAGRVAVLEERIEAREADLARLEGEAARRQELLAKATRNQELLEEFYGERLSSERHRLTRILAEVKELARRVGLEPGSISYPDERFEEFGLSERAIVFSVAGTYPQLRQLINLLELSDSFLVLEQVELSESSGSDARLRMSLRISTLFVTEEGPAAHVAGGRG